jgi:negative regulator of replication initiation
MRTIRVSEEVWQAIAAKGAFGETEDDVLRRVFELEEAAVKIGRRRGRGSRRYAAKRMSPKIVDGALVIQFEDGARKQWPLPNLTDKEAIRRVREAAVRWAIEQGASVPGQANAVRKALTDAGYLLTR